MATLVIRGLDEQVKARLRLRAAERGRSMEAEAREILTSAVGATRPAKGLGSFVRDRFAEVGGVEIEIPARDDAAPAADLA